MKATVKTCQWFKIAVRRERAKVAKEAVARMGTAKTAASRARISSPRRQLTARCRRQQWQELRWRTRPKLVSGSRNSCIGSGFSAPENTHNRLA
jgi:hypothetical protein